MSELYERLKSFRDESYSKISSAQGEGRNHFSKDFGFAKDVLNQLMQLAFYNESDPDALPDVFFIHSVHFTLEDFEHLMQELGLDVKVEVTSQSWVSGVATFKVTMVG